METKKKDIRNILRELITHAKYEGLSKVTISSPQILAKSELPYTLNEVSVVMKLSMNQCDRLLLDSNGITIILFKTIR